MITLLLPLLAGCFKTVEPRVEVEAPASADAFPWDLYDRAFSGRVDGGLIDYRTLQDDPEALDRFIGNLAVVSPASHPELFPTKEAALAYWLDAYNALAVRGVLDRPEMVSVIDDKVEYFYSTRYRIGGQKVSLYKLENGIIRAEFADPRVHFFLNCQSMSCPAFPSQAVRPETVDAALEEATRAFVNDPAHVQVMEDGTVAVSSIFQWYAEDFGGEAGVLPFVHRYNGLVPAEGKVTYKEYDWTLIAQSGRRPE
ncbi:MAG: DUF547 domain-containing protein [Myxococcales bacterium]|nr:DUF547 domain-containing protein [Myxococcales bacterium]MCB9673091.1 DUF547 domain-containing protein [Alphaproteobacteria bacterium]